MKTLSCAAMGMTGCDFVARGETEEDVIDELTRHAHEAHPESFNDMEPAEMVEIMKTKITEE